MIRRPIGMGVVAGFLIASGALLAATSWHEATEVQLAIAGDIGSEPMECRVEMLSDGDARITLPDATLPSAQWPTIVVVAGQAMLVRNLELEEGYEIDALDAPVLMLQLVLDLLTRGVEGGPDRVAGEAVEVQQAEQSEPISVSTTSAGGEFSAPWRLSGTVERESENRVSYALDFSYTAGADEARIDLAGSWQMEDPRPELDPEMSLSGWSSYLIGPIERQMADSTIYDFGARPRSFRASTLRELRREISELK